MPQIECSNCGGEGGTGSACWDDLCHGGEVPCMHGDFAVIKCDWCHGTGWVEDDEDDYPEDPEAETEVTS